MVTHTFQILVTIIRECVMQPKVLKNKVPLGGEYMSWLLSRCNDKHNTFMCIPSTSSVRTHRHGVLYVQLSNGNMFVGPLSVELVGCRRKCRNENHGWPSNTTNPSRFFQELSAPDQFQIMLFSKTSK